MPEDTKVGIIGNFLETTKEDYVCSSMIYELAFHHENEEPKPYESKEIGAIMRNEFSNDWKSISTHRFKKYGTQRGWKRKHIDEFVEVDENVQLPFDV